jgi:16S rRNA processing protein RimM
MNSHAVAFFDGVEDRDAAEGLIRAILWVDEDALATPAEEDAWFDHQLVGLDVVRDGAVVGKVVRVDHFPAQDLLIVKVRDDEVLIPFVKAIVPEVDVAAGRLIVTPPPGLFEDLQDDDSTPVPTGPDGAETADGAEVDSAD